MKQTHILGFEKRIPLTAFLQNADSQRFLCKLAYGSNMQPSLLRFFKKAYGNSIISNPNICVCFILYLKATWF